jgi:F-type H+-transporting ATPase subunit gamma
MASTINLKRRIISIKNTSQITKAMQLVSASKLKRSQDYALKSREYYLLAKELSWRLSQKREALTQPMFLKRELSSKLYVIITSNNGLAGSYNADVIKILTKSLSEDQALNIKSDIIAIGKKGAQFVRHLKENQMIAFYPEFSDKPTANDLRPLLSTILGLFRENKVNQVDLIYTAFHSTISQTALKTELLPIQINLDDQVYPQKSETLTNFEPDIETVIDQIAERLVEAELFQAVVDSKISEYSMRMLAMKNATDNARDLIDDYTLELNTLRQSSITQELAEISGGVEALKE